MFQSQKTNIDIKCAVLKNSIPGGGVSWMLFCVQRPTGKILHHMAGRLLSLHVIMLSISTWKKNLLGILVTIAAQMEEGSLGFTASSFKLFVNPLLTKSFLSIMYPLIPTISIVILLTICQTIILILVRRNWHWIK